MDVDELITALQAIQDPEFEVLVINAYGEPLRRLQLSDDKGLVELYFEGDE